MIIKVYSKPNCPACDTLKAKLKAEGKDFTEIKVGEDLTAEAFREQFPFVRSMPHIEIED